MNIKLLSTAAIALSLLAGSAMAQETPAAPADSGAASTTAQPDAGKMRTDFASENERAWYMENSTWLGGFFTDGTMSTAKSDAEAKAIFGAMGADSQAGMKAACEKAASDRGSYGSVTIGLCSSVGLI